MKQNKYLLYYNYQHQTRFVIEFDAHRFTLNTTSNPDYAKRFDSLAYVKVWFNDLSEMFPEYEWSYVRLKNIGLPTGYTVNLGNCMFVRDNGNSFILTQAPYFAEKHSNRQKAERLRDTLANMYDEPYFRVRPFWSLITYNHLLIKLHY